MNEGETDNEGGLGVGGMGRIKGESKRDESD